MLLRLIFVLFIFTDSAMANSSCQEIFQTGHPKSGWLKTGVGFVKNSWHQFRYELAAEGPVRLALAPRRNPEKFNWWFTGDLLGGPAELYSTVKHRVFHRRPLLRRPSIFVSIPASMILLVGLPMGLEAYNIQEQNQQLQQRQSQGVMGIDWIMAFKLSQVLSGSEAIMQLEKFQENLYRWGQGQAPLPRIQQLIELGIIKSEAELSLFESLVRSTLKNTVHEVGKDHTSILRAHLLNEIEKVWPHKTATELELASWVYTVPIQINGRLDIELYRDYLIARDDHWKGNLPDDQLQILKGIHEISQGQKFSEPWLVTFIEAGLSNTDRVRKLKKALVIGFPKSHLHIVSRPDLSAFAQPFEFWDLKAGAIQLNDELDWWNLIINDWRFHGLKHAWLKGDLNSVSILYQAREIIAGLDQLFRIQKQSIQLNSHGEILLTPPSIEQACKLVESNQSLFSHIKDWSQEKNLSGEQGEAFQYLLVKAYWDYYALDSFMPTNERGQLHANLQQLEAMILQDEIGEGFVQHVQRLAPTGNLGCK